MAASTGAADRAPLDAGPTNDKPDNLEARLLASGRGDNTAFAAVYDQTAQRVHGLVLRVLGDVHQSEEVTQDVFLQIWQNANHFDPGRGSALSWVLTVAHRRAVDRVRASEAWRRRDHAEAELTRQSFVDETSETAHASLEAQVVRAAMVRLSPTQRRALELAYFGGHTHSEVARLLEIPLGTAKTRIRDGLIRLRDVMTTVEPVPA